MAIRLFLVAHDPSLEPGAARFPHDAPLNAKACAATRRATAHLPRFDRAFASPAAAALETAAALGVPATVEPRLRDQDWGRWAGRPLAEVASTEPELFAAWVGGAAPPGGEPSAAAVARVGLWLDGLCGTEGRTLAIAPPGIVRAALLHVLGAPASAARVLDVRPLTLAEFSSDGRRWTLRRFGESLDGAASEGVPIRPDNL